MKKLEKCARAICKGCGLNPDAPGPQYQGERIQPLWRRFEDDARAVIRCLMEPDALMLESGAKHDDGFAGDLGDYRSLFRAMLQSVLDESKE